MRVSESYIWIFLSVAFEIRYLLYLTYVGFFRLSLSPSSSLSLLIRVYALCRSVVSLILDCFKWCRIVLVALWNTSKFGICVVTEIMVFSKRIHAIIFITAEQIQLPFCICCGVSIASMDNTRYRKQWYENRWCIRMLLQIQNAPTCTHKWNSLRKPKTKRLRAHSQMEFENISRKINGKNKNLYHVWLVIICILHFWVFSFGALIAHCGLGVWNCNSCLCMLCLFDFNIHAYVFVVLQHKINSNREIGCKIFSGYLNVLRLYKNQIALPLVSTVDIHQFKVHQNPLKTPTPVPTESTEMNIVNVGLFGWLHSMWPLKTVSESTGGNSVNNCPL